MASFLTIDLRSDTVTKPTSAMRNAMASAEVGDDVLGDDPTVMALQERVAAVLKKEAALFVPSGTMANQICIAAQTRPGEELLLEEDAHILNHEAGAPALLSGVQIRTAKGNLGRLSAAQIRAKLQKGTDHTAATTLVSVENTHNRGGGSVYSRDELRAIRAVTEGAGVRLHLDGARLWNAAVAAECEEWEFAQYADSVSVCFSKGLGAPVGSAVAGSREFIQHAHRFRKIFGGGMRQAGILAAAALYALDHHRQDLIEDHHKARTLADLLLQSSAFSMPELPSTNIVYIDVTDERVNAELLEQDCGKAGVLFFAEGPARFRLVTHRDVSLERVKAAAEIILKQVALC